MYLSCPVSRLSMYQLSTNPHGDTVYNFKERHDRAEQHKRTCWNGPMRWRWCRFLRPLRIHRKDIKGYVTDCIRVSVPENCRLLSQQFFVSLDLSGSSSSAGEPEGFQLKTNDLKAKQGIFRWRYLQRYRDYIQLSWAQMKAERKCLKSCVRWVIVQRLTDYFVHLVPTCNCISNSIFVVPRLRLLHCNYRMLYSVCWMSGACGFIQTLNLLLLVDGEIYFGVLEHVCLHMSSLIHLLISSDLPVSSCFHCSLSAFISWLPAPRACPRYGESTVICDSSQQKSRKWKQKSLSESEEIEGMKKGNELKEWIRNEASVHCLSIADYDRCRSVSTVLCAMIPPRSRRRLNAHTGRLRSLPGRICSDLLGSAWSILRNAKKW